MKHYVHWLQYEPDASCWQDLLQNLWSPVELCSFEPWGLSPAFFCVCARSEICCQSETVIKKLVIPVKSCFDYMCTSATHVKLMQWKYATSQLMNRRCKGIMIQFVGTHVAETGDVPWIVLKYHSFLLSSWLKLSRLCHLIWRAQIRVLELRRFFHMEWKTTRLKFAEVDAHEWFMQLKVEKLTTWQDMITIPVRDGKYSHGIEVFSFP